MSTTFINALSEKKDRSDCAKLRERCDYMAPNIYGQWLLQKMVGAKVSTTWGKTRSYAVGGFNDACMKLCEAAQSEDPSKLFGYKVASRISSIFKLGRKYNSEERVQQDLSKLVKSAAGIINKTFETREGQQPDGTTVVYRRCEFDAHPDGLTYLPLDKSRLPWEAELEWPRIKERPNVNTEAASAETLDTLGFVVEEEAPAALMEEAAVNGWSGEVAGGDARAIAESVEFDGGDAWGTADAAQGWNW